MARHLLYLFAITVVGTGVLVNSQADTVAGTGVLVSSQAEAAKGLRCEDRNTNCMGKCQDVTGGAGDWRGHQNKCVEYCIKNLMTCYTTTRR